MSKLIGDVGSTNADWVYISDTGNKEFFRTKGYNPYIHTIEPFTDVLAELIGDRPYETVIYYGAGVTDEIEADRVKSILRKALGKKEIIIHSDMLSACHASCGHTAGNVAILGTGSNFCQYDGEYITTRCPSLGYILGDEGSGADIGKRLIKTFFYGTMPIELRSQFSGLIPFEKSTFLKKFRDHPTPNTYLGSFSSFCKDFPHHEFIQKLIKEAFWDFFVTRQEYFNHDLPIHFAGSVANAFPEILKEALEPFNLTLGKIVEKPIDYLADYYVVR